MARAPNALQSALRLCESDKVKDRSEGISAIRTFFSNKENLAVFQETARRDGGGGWVAFFQCLFQVVSLEKRATLRKTANAQTEKRLADAISLVRFMAERSVHLISRKALSALVAHMSSLLVYSSAIFPPAALDYAKALRTLLSYPPHLEHLEPQAWRVLVGICWSAILGDEVTIEEGWEEEMDEDMGDPSPSSGMPATQATKTFAKGRTNTQATTELARLVPILLSSPSAPLLPPMPTSLAAYTYEQSLGLSMLLKVQRFLSEFPSETSSHLPVLRSMNVVLAELELNCRADFITGALKLLPSLCSIWAFKNKTIREQILISLRLVLPFVTHRAAKEKDRHGTARAALEKLAEMLGRESTLRGGFMPLDLGTLRLMSKSKIKAAEGIQPFETRCFTAGHDFDHDCALRWAAIELYAEVCFYLEQTADLSQAPTPSRSEGTQSKRRKVTQTPLQTLILSTSFGSILCRAHALQVLIMITDRHWSDIHLEAQVDIRQTFISLLQEEDPSLQSWAFVGISTLAALPPIESSLLIPEMGPMTPSAKGGRIQTEEADFARAWSIAIRKSSINGVSRAACLAAQSMLSYGKIDSPTVVKDLGSLLQSVDIQGPPYPYDSVCVLLDRAITIIRNDVRLYNMKLEERVISWFIKWNALEGTRGKGRLDQHAPADFLPLLCNVCHLGASPLAAPKTTDFLPDCAIVDRVLEEHRTRPIRQFTLFGQISDPPRSSSDTAPFTTQVEEDSGKFLEGRPKRVSECISSFLEAFLKDWPSSSSSNASRPAIPPERCRRSIDIIVLALSFQATLQANGIRPDSDCIRLALALLDVMLPVLGSSAYDTPAQHLMWKGWDPIINTAATTHALWPVLLKPNVLSGIRGDLLPPHNEDEGKEGEFGTGDQLLSTLWNLPGVSASLKVLFEPALDIFAGSETVTSNNTPYTVMHVQDDDDFGEIRTADSDAMPLSQEALECQRTTTALLTTLAGLRLRGSLLVSPNRVPSKDNNLINAFLSAEGQRMVQLGTVVCEALKRGILRLNAEAIDLILSSLDEMHRSYAYTRDSGLLKLMLDFMTASAPLWLSVDRSASDLPDRVISLAKSLYRKSLAGQLSSWQVRLALLVFIDEYLDYDPDQTVWMDVDEDMSGDGTSLVASDIVSAGLMDPDIRLRFRAATSTAGILYLSSIPVEQHMPFYTDLVNVLPREPKHWDSFITDILWKLNCCITSPQLRAATIYHLYEIPPSTSDYNHHLQVGLETVSRRLGLTGISQLLLAYAPLVISSQIVTSQSPMRVSHRLYGFPTRKAFAQNTLEVAASSVLLYALAERNRTDGAARQYNGAAETFAALCDAAGLVQTEVGVRHLPATAARALSDPGSGLFVEASAFDRSRVAKMLLTLPGISSTDSTQVIAGIAEDIATHLFALLDLAISDEEVIVVLDARLPKSRPGSSIFSALVPPQSASVLAPPLVPSATLEDVLGGIDYLHQTQPALSSAKILFNTLVRLFHRVNDAFLISEQHRHLRAIALVISLYSENLTHPAILGLFLRETIPLLKLRDIAPIALCMLQWGFDRIGIGRAPQAPDDLSQLIIGLGAVRESLAGSIPDSEDQASRSAQDHGTSQQFDQWILESAGAWQKIPAMRDALAIAKSTWPASLAAALTDIGRPTFEALCENTAVVKSTDVLPMCSAMVQTLQSYPQNTEEGVARFQRQAFWNIKQQLYPSPRTKADITAFVDLLYAGHGQIHPPGLEAMERNADGVRLNPLKTRHREDPAPHLRANLVDRIVLLTRTTEYKARSTAFGVLQGLLPHIADDSTGALVPKPTQDLLALLNPSVSTSSSAPAQPLSVLVEDEAWIKKSRDVTEWSASLATVLCNTMSARQPFYSVPPTLFDAIPSAARDLVPILVQATLSVTDPSAKSDLQERYKSLSTHLMAVLQCPLASVDTLRAVVDIILHLRNFQPPYRQEELGYESWLDVDKLSLSEAALKCGSFASALMFLEGVRSDRKDKRRVVDLYDKRVQQIMYETYSNVEDPDGFYGIKTSDTWDALNRRLQHEGEHWRSFGLHSAALGIGGSSSQASMLVMRDLHNLGFDQVSGAVFSSLQQTIDKPAEDFNEPLLFELAWRTSDWDLPVPAETTPSPESLLYTSLRSVHRERDLLVAQNSVGKAIDREIGILRDCGVECMTQIKKAATDLICLHEIQLWLDPLVQSELDSRNMAAPSLVRFTSIDSAFSFADAERIIATRRSLLLAAKEREKLNTFGDMATPRLEALCELETKCLLRLGEMARAEGTIQAAINALVAVQHLERDMGTPTDAVQDEFSQVLWAQGEHALAIQHVEGRMKGLQGSKGEVGKRSAVLLSRLANWTAKAKLRAPNDINSTFEEAVKLSSTHKVPNVEQSQLCHDYALFADAQQAALARSPELERLTTYRERKEAELRSSTPSAPSKKSAKSSAKTGMTLHLEREMREDEEAIEALLRERSAYAQTALKMYAKALALSDEHDDSTTRMSSLWLEHDEDDEVNTSFAGPLQQIPSHKFIFLSPQLAARLDRPKTLTPFNDALNKLVLRVSMDHPYHILYQVITLADSLSSLSKSRRASDMGAEGRGPAAAAILATISSSKDSAHSLARSASADMQMLASAATAWCLSRSKEEESVSLGKAINVPSDCPLKQLPPNLSIPVATAPPPIDPLGKYADMPTLVRYRSTYAVLGGIHRPKKMLVIDSTGKKRSELFKGEDELRQDAVMEQVFEMSNKLLRRDRKTKTRDLRFRTYRVIPLARKTGIMEFVGDSQAIGDWLKPAHNRYGKMNGDIAADEFRKNLKPLQDKEKNWGQLPAKYMDLMSKFHPVMRHFFAEKHRDPMAWFTMRLNYTRSVAVTSVVGWMLGIGDRHCSNILIDQKSGELVHIDFGIVFEDGRRLRIPEKVPFRLTNDLVDGFGVTGVEGTFRRCSEHTLRVLRESSELIMTVLEVFKHDPLYAWEADPEKLQRAQGGARVSAGTSASALEKADRILSKIKGKLRDDLSVEYTVNQLIQEARDVENLAKIFVGWQPWF